MTSRLTDRISARIQSAGREEGMTTAEYAVGTVAAAGCGGVLVKVLTSPSVQHMIEKAIEKAFHFFF